MLRLERGRGEWSKRARETVGGIKSYKVIRNFAWFLEIASAASRTCTRNTFLNLECSLVSWRFSVSSLPRQPIEMFSYGPLQGGSLRPNCSGCQFGANRPKTSGGICSLLLGRAGARALQDRIARIALRRGPHRRCVLAAQGYRRNSLPLSKCSYAYGDVSPRETKSHESCTG